MDTNQLQQQIDNLQKQFDSLKQSSSIPYAVSQAFAGAGFLTSFNFVVMGQTEVGAGGTALIPIPRANKYSMAIATYANFPGSGGASNVVDAYIEPIPGTANYRLHLEGTATKRINYVVFLNNIVQPTIDL